MMSKVVILFLVFMGALAMFGKLHWIGGKRLKSTKCKACKRHKIGSGPCACGKGDA